MKKFVSIVVTLAMLFAMTSVSFAAEVSATPNTKTYIGEVENGNIFTMQANDKSVVALTNNESHLIDISIQYSNQPDTVYQRTLSNYSSSIRFAPESVSFWLGVIDYMEQNLDDASVVYFETVTYDVPIDITNSRDSVLADLRQNMISLLGTDEYPNEPLFSSSFYYQGQEINIYETMEFRFVETGYKSWAQSLSASSFIISIIGALSPSNALLAATCSAFSIALSGASLIPAGSMEVYDCTSLTYRYITINNSEYIYNMTHKLIGYDGYNPLGNYTHAFINPDSKTTTYPDGLNYFSSISDQIADAYELFLEIGQMP